MWLGECSHSPAGDTKARVPALAQAKHGSLWASMTAHALQMHASMGPSTSLGQATSTGSTPLVYKQGAEDSSHALPSVGWVPH